MKLLGDIVILFDFRFSSNPSFKLQRKLNLKCRDFSFYRI